MIIAIILMAIAILLGLGGSIILVLGLVNKKNAMIISGGIMLLFTILFCTSAVFCSARFLHNRNHHKPFDSMMAPMGMHTHNFMNMQNYKEWESKPMDAPKGQCTDSTGTRKRCPKK
jgi:hypothetical protein